MGGLVGGEGRKVRFGMWGSGSGVGPGVADRIGRHYSAARRARLLQRQFSAFGDRPLGRIPNARTSS